MNEKKIEKIDFKKSKIQKYYIYYSIYNNKEIDNPALIQNFRTLTNINLNISRSQISKIKNKIKSVYKGSDILELIKKLKINIPDLKYNIEDIKYDILIKNKSINREERIIYFGIDENLQYLNKDKCQEFFADIISNNS
jgi:hypothetical protein